VERKEQSEAAFVTETSQIRSCETYCFSPPSAESYSKEGKVKNKHKPRVAHLVSPHPHTQQG